MTAVAVTELKSNFKEYAKKVADGEPVLIKRPKSEPNLVIVTEQNYNMAKRAMAYYEKIAGSGMTPSDTLEAEEKTVSVDYVINAKERAELIDGELFIQDSGTTPEHNEVTSEVEFSFRLFIKEHGGGCKVYRENVALICDSITGETDRNVVIPDLMVICSDTEKVDSKGVHTTPDFVMEVTSPSSRNNDYNKKKELYERIGVKEYWVIDIEKKCLSIYTSDGCYDPAQVILHPKKIPVGIYNGELIIDFENLL